MRDKFKDLMANNFASFKYTNITSDKPDTDPICRMYNNIFSIPSDTHMSITADGERVITGHIINTQHWGSFCCSCCWGAVDFRTSGTWSLCEFLHKNGLKGEISTLNGDVVYKIVPREHDEKCPGCELTPNPTVRPGGYYTVGESKMPHPIASLTTSGNPMHIMECFGVDIDSAAQKMNESCWVKGSNWVPFDNQIVGLVGNQVYKINLEK